MCTYFKVTRSQQQMSMSKSEKRIFYGKRQIDRVIANKRHNTLIQVKTSYEMAMLLKYIKEKASIIKFDILEDTDLAMNYIYNEPYTIMTPRFDTGDVDVYDTNNNKLDGVKVKLFGIDYSEVRVYIKKPAKYLKVYK